MEVCCVWLMEWHGNEEIYVSSVHYITSRTIMFFGVAGCQCHSSESCFIACLNFISSLGLGPSSELLCSGKQCKAYQGHTVMEQWSRDHDLGLHSESHNPKRATVRE